MSAHTPRRNDDRIQCPDCGHRLNAIPCPACGSKVWSEAVLKESRMKEAAPEMLELLKQANSHISCLDDRMYKSSIQEEIEELIQKIEGES